MSEVLHLISSDLRSLLAASHVNDGYRHQHSMYINRVHAYRYHTSAYTCNSTVCMLDIIMSSIFVSFQITRTHVVLNTSRLRYQQSNSNSDIRPILTLYTTTKRTPTKNISDINVIKNWALLQPWVQPVLFIQNNTDQFIIDLAIRHSWYVEKVPSANRNGTPVFKDLYFKAKPLLDTPYCGYSNGDILYDDNLIRTLLELIRIEQQSKTALNGSTLVIGNRRNYNMGNLIDLYEFKDVSQKVKVTPMFRPEAEDYFLFNGRFPWKLIKDVVVGGPGNNFCNSRLEI